MEQLPDTAIVLHLDGDRLLGVGFLHALRDSILSSLTAPAIMLP